MNEQLQIFVREQLKEGLSKLPEKWVLLFKRMYSHDNLEADINDIVDAMPEDKLDWAMRQVDKSIDSINNQRSKL